MKHTYWGVAMTLVIGMALLTGCPPRTAQQPSGGGRVAGTQERTGQQAPSTTVTVRITDQGINISPSAIPPGNATLRLTNDTNTAQSITVGKGNQQRTYTIQPGQTQTVTMTSLTAGQYQISRPASGNRPAVRETLTVSQPSGAQRTTTDVTVRITDQALSVTPATIPPGDARMRVTNDTDTAQTLTVGQGNQRKSYTIQPGQTQTITVQNLAAGRYQVAVPARGNRQAMQQTLTVQQPTSGTTTQGTAVTVRVTDSGVTVTPASIPPGAATLQMVNGTQTAQTVTVSGPGLQQKSYTLRPGQTTTVSLPKAQAGNYTFSAPGGTGAQPRTATLRVTAPAGGTTGGTGTPPSTPRTGTTPPAGGGSTTPPPSTR